MISVCLQGKPFNVIVIKFYAPTINAEEAEIERFYDDFQDPLELTPNKDVLFILGDWNAKVGSKKYLATAAAKSLQSCATLCDPLDGRPPGSPVLRILQARTLELFAISFSDA